MKKIVLLGDSIRQIGYGLKVPQLLGEGYEVWQPDDNCRYSIYTLRGMHDWRANLEGSDVIHWNNGLWDNCDILGDGIRFTPIDRYVEVMCRIASILKGYSKHVIFATTTPVLDGLGRNDNETTRAYNAAVVPALEAMGIEINDLYSAVEANMDAWIKKSDLVHLTEEGIDGCAAIVADKIRAACERLG